MATFPCNRIYIDQEGSPTLCSRTLFLIVGCNFSCGLKFAHHKGGQAGLPGIIRGRKSDLSQRLVPGRASSNARSSGDLFWSISHPNTSPL